MFMLIWGFFAPSGFEKLTNLGGLKVNDQCYVMFCVKRGDFVKGLLIALAMMTSLISGMISILYVFKKIYLES